MYPIRNDVIGVIEMKQKQNFEEALEFMDFCIRQNQEDIKMSREGIYRFSHPGVFIVALGSRNYLGLSKNRLLDLIGDFQKER